MCIRDSPYSIHDDDRPNEKFCNFLSPEESIEYHSRLLMSDRYARLSLIHILSLPYLKKFSAKIQFFCGKAKPELVKVWALL